MKRIPHLLALSLAGTWLLLMPPQEKRPFGQTRAITEAPLSQWTVKETFPTEADCRKKSHPASQGEVIGPFHIGQMPSNQKMGEDCIASDDPRLKP